MYGARAPFMEGVFAAIAVGDFREENAERVRQKRAAVMANLEAEIAHWAATSLHRGRDTSPEYRAYMYTQFLAFRDAQSQQG